jgi:hypothetical protein
MMMKLNKKKSYRLICGTVLVGIYYLACIQERTFLWRHGRPPLERLLGPNNNHLLQ